MQLSNSLKVLAATLVGAAALGGATAAQAHGNVSFSIGIGAPLPVYAQPAPVYVEPAPVYAAPQVVYGPRPVYVEPAPVYVQRRVVAAPVFIGHREDWRRAEWQRREWREHHEGRGYR